MLLESRLFCAVCVLSDTFIGPYPLKCTPRSVLLYEFCCPLPQANKLTVMRSVVRNICRPWRRWWTGGSSSSRDFAGEEGLGADELRGLVYSESDEIPETQYSSQLRRYKEWVRAHVYLVCVLGIFKYVSYDEIVRFDSAVIFAIHVGGDGIVCVSAPYETGRWPRRTNFPSCFRPAASCTTSRRTEFAAAAYVGAAYPTAAMIPSETKGLTLELHVADGMVLIGYRLWPKLWG